MNFKELLEARPLYWALVFALTGFATGFGVFEGILRVAQLERVGKDRLAALERTERDHDTLAQSLEACRQDRAKSPSSAQGASPSSAEPRPSLTLAPEVTDETGRPINRREAPFKIRVKGTATGVERSYVYLVVDDSNALWIMPTAGLGPNVGGEFSGYCYLGQIAARDSIGKLYRIFAAATNREYTEYETLDRRTLQAESSIIELLRVR